MQEDIEDDPMFESTVDLLEAMLVYIIKEIIYLFIIIIVIIILFLIVVLFLFINYF